MRSKVILGLSYYNEPRHEMRVAFWWKLNWSWFCVIQCSYEEATKPINETEIEPFPDTEAIQRFERGEIDVEVNMKVRPQSSNQDTISESMEDVITQHPIPDGLSEHLKKYWDMAKRLNKKPTYPHQLGESEWVEIGDVLVKFGHELIKYGLLDMALGLWESEIMHRSHHSLTLLMI